MKTVPKRILIPFVILALGGILAACGGGPTLTVNSADDADDGVCNSTHCSLREAIHKANTYDSGTLVRIHFNIGGGGLQTIRPLSPYGLIGAKVFIDGTTQPGFSGTPIIELDGTDAGFGDGFTLIGFGSTVKGFVINRFSQSGIDVMGQDITIQGNYIGTDAAGSAAMGNAMWGITLGCNTGQNTPAGTVVGGNSPAQRNVISANAGGGIFFVGQDCFGEGRVTIQGNYIGLNAAGTAALGNHGPGIELGRSTYNLIGGEVPGDGNVISGNDGDGIVLNNGGDHTTIIGNRIGTDAAGGQAVGNAKNGIQFDAGVEVAIGGNFAGAGNLISGNGLAGIFSADGSSKVLGNRIGTNRDGTAALGNQVGIRVRGCGAGMMIGGPDQMHNTISGNLAEGILLINTGGGECSDGAEVVGNYIGTNSAGTAAIGNLTGIHVMTDHVLIGGAEAYGNLISGNLTSGIIIEADHAYVQGNRIGTDLGGNAPLGNGEFGLLVKGDADDNWLAENTIAYNGTIGAAVLLDGAAGNRLSKNSIHDNGFLGIAIDEEAVISNDNLDTDTGGNGRQNYPDLNTAELDGADLTVSGSLSSSPGTSYTVEIFANDACDPSGYGEGDRWLYSSDVMTGLDGVAALDPAFSTNGLDTAQFITATATDPAGNTSGFSNCIPITEKGAAAATEIPAGMTFQPYLDPADIFWGRCTPDTARISVEIVNPPEPVSYVLLFARLMNPQTGEKTEWSEGLSMLSGGKNVFFYDLSAYDMNDYNRFSSGMVQYQFVVYNKAQEVIGRSEVYADLAFGACGKPAGAVSTPTPKSPLVGK